MLAGALCAAFVPSTLFAQAWAEGSGAQTSGAPFAYAPSAESPASQGAAGSALEANVGHIADANSPSAGSPGAQACGAEGAGNAERDSQPAESEADAALDSLASAPAPDAASAAPASDLSNAAEQATSPASPVDTSRSNRLMAAIAASYVGATDPWKVLDLAAVGRLSADQRAAFVPLALADMRDPQAASAATAHQRNILGLTAAGIDATTIPDGDAAYDAVGAMASKVTAASPVNVLAFTLLSYAAGYDVPANANLSQRALIASILGNQLADGGFSYSGATADADMTAMVVSALAPYAGSDAAVQPAIDRALAALKAIQHEDGGFGASGKGVQNATNANSTAMAVIALCAVGIDPATEWKTADGSTPLGALLSQATADDTAFLYAGKVNDSATEQGFRALVAYQGFKGAAGPYNIYVEAKEGRATFVDAAVPPSGEEPSDNPNAPQSPAGSPDSDVDPDASSNPDGLAASGASGAGSSNGSGGSSSGSTLAKTGDAVGSLALAAAAGALGSLAVAALAAIRRARERA